MGLHVTVATAVCVPPVTGDGPRICGTPKNWEKTCLGSQQTFLFHRKKNYDSDMRNRLKSLYRSVIVCNNVYTMQNHIVYFQNFIKQLLWYSEAQMMFKNKAALEPSEH